MICCSKCDREYIYTRSRGDTKSICGSCYNKRRKRDVQKQKDSATCTSCDLSIEENQRKCFHYTNLQPLWKKDNLSKGKKMI